MTAVCQALRYALMKQGYAKQKSKILSPWRLHSSEGKQ